ncbi:hypothetical protein ACWHAM_06635 [Paenibacillus terrae]
MDNGSPRGSVYGDSEGFHLGNMASIIIRSVDDATYFQGEVDFNYATVTGLDLNMQNISGLSDKLSDIDKRISEIYSELFTDMITNASFDPSSRNLKL